MSLGETIRKIRKSHRATLEEIAFAAKTDAANLSRIERGKQGYTPEMLENIAHALGLSVAKLHAMAETEGVEGNGQKMARQTLLEANTYHTPLDQLKQLNPNHLELAMEFISLLLRRQSRSGKK